MSSHELRRVLYVEDEPDIQSIARLALEGVGGLEVHICSSGREALVEIPSRHPDLVLLDVMMPGMDGVSTLQALRADERVRDIPVVFMTAKARPDEVGSYRALGALDVIAKPFDPMTLAADLRRIWAARHG